MSLIGPHLDQIALSCQGIDALPFPPPKIFTNALLSNHDITSLIRDTEPHERALFSVPPTPPPLHSRDPDPKPAARRQTVFNVAAGEVTTGPPTSRAAQRRPTAVAAVLGGALHDQLRRAGEPSTGVPGGAGPARGDVDVDALLRGAEKLCGVYALPGAPERISSLRARHAQDAHTLAYYEGRVAEQGQALDALGRERREADEAEFEDEGLILTEEDLRAEEEEVKELDRKKRELQQRLQAMGKDLGALLNM